MKGVCVVRTSLRACPKKSFDFSDWDIFQLFDFERFLFDRAIPLQGQALWSMIRGKVAEFLDKIMRQN
jgi:hypothetical protein